MNTVCVSFGGSPSKLEKTSWFIDRGWSTQEPNLWKPDWVHLSNSFSSMYLKRELNIRVTEIFPKMGKKETGRLFFMGSFSPLLWIGTSFAFFQRLGNVFLSLQHLNMMNNDFTILLLYRLNILMETSWCPWVLLISSVLIT